MSRKITTEEFRKKLYEIYGNQFDLLTPYINNQTKVSVRCNVCGNVIYKRPAKMVGADREGCYVCSGKNRYKTKETLQGEVDSLYPGMYTINGDYINARTKISVTRTQCDHTYEISPDNLLRGKGCPKCGMRQSGYMNIVEEYLNKHGVLFEKEKRFSDCKNIRTLPFDYYIPEQNTCIEVDGEFHFERNSVYINHHSEYAAISNRDMIKTNYCADNNIKLIRLPYTKANEFEDILSRELHVNTEITQPIQQVVGYCNA